MTTGARQITVGARRTVSQQLLDVAPMGSEGLLAMLAESVRRELGEAGCHPATIHVTYHRHVLPPPPASGRLQRLARRLGFGPKPSLWVDVIGQGARWV